jgi:hypothetical protein
VRIVKTKLFVRFARKEEIDDLALREAIERAERGLIDADLGGGLIKQRVARPGEGRSGGYRTIVVYRAENFAFFVYGFAKNAKDNINARDLRFFKEAAAAYLALDETELRQLLKDGTLIEVLEDG